MRDLIDAAALAIGAGLAEAADAAVDQARIHFFQIVIGDLQAALHRRAHVFHQHIGFFDELHKDFVAFLALEIQLDRAFIAMQVLEIRTVAAAHHILAAGRRRLNTDDVRAPIRQMAHAGGASARERQIEHDNAAQW